METPELELSAIRPARRTLRIRTDANPDGLRPDGSKYELRTPEEFSILEMHELGEIQKRVQANWEKKPADADRALNDLMEFLIDGAARADLEMVPALAKVQLMRVFSESVPAPAEATVTPIPTAAAAKTAAHARA